MQGAIAVVGRTGRYATIGMVTAATFVADELTKVAARAWLPLCEASTRACGEIDLSPWLGFVRLANDGSPLGFAPGLWVWVAIAFVGLLLVPVYARSRTGAGVLAVAAGLQLGGALGNLFDRIAFGGATDLVRIGSVVINLADIALLVGAVMATAILVRSRA
jgi:signal peptidase II